jgi:transposase, IS30 family
MGQLTVEQRYTIAAMRQNGHSQKDIAEKIGKHKSVVNRELKRNMDLRSGAYRAELAQRKCDDRHHSKPKHLRFTEAVKELVNEGLEKLYSPEQIVGFAKKKNENIVSHERIYQYIWSDKRKGGDLHKNLRHKGKKYRKRGNLKDKRGMILNRIDISERPPVVESRERFGDLEIDTIIGKDRKGAILTINDRKTGMVKIRKLQGKDADKLAEVAIETLQEWAPNLHTITSDNGKEFAAHSTIATALNIDFYFAKPYHSWERGSNENLNGLIRQYIPKGTDFSNISEKEIQEIEDNLNDRPRKRFDFFSPNEVMQQTVAFIT